MVDPDIVGPDDAGEDPPEPDAGFVPVADPVAKRVAPGGVPSQTAVTFRGWLSEPKDGVYRLFTSPWFDEWLEIRFDAGTKDLLHQHPGAETNDGSSIVWVSREATIVKCQSAQACHFAEQEAELSDDPTASNYAAARRYPKYGGG